MSKNKIMPQPLDLSKSEIYIDKEFYLMIQGHASKKRMMELIETYNTARPFRKFYRSTINWIKGKKTTNVKETEGSLIEIISRENGYLKGNLWNPINNIFDAEGMCVSKKIPLKDTYWEYIFTPETIIIQENSSEISSHECLISGRAKRYNLNTNTTAEETEQLVLCYKKIPTTKSGDIGTITSLV